VAAANKAEQALAKARETNDFALVKHYEKELAFQLSSHNAGLYAISLGLSKEFPDDHEMLRHGIVMYDALYAWCESCQGETHNWPPEM
jgi:hypothetical protein